MGCMVYDWAIERKFFRPGAKAALSQFCQSHGLPTDEEDATALALVIQKAFYEGRLGDHATAEMQVWAYAGCSEAEFRQLARTALEEGGHQKTLHKPILELAAWTRQLGGRPLIVSASPQWVVEEATRDLGFAAHEIAGGVPQMTSVDTMEALIAPALAAPLPYGPQKVVAGRRLLEGSPWVAALGDSSFDLDMFAAAQLAGGIGNKETMLRGLEELPQAVHLQLD